MENNKHSVASGLLWTYGERFCTQLVSLIVSIILARILSPDNYGVISIAKIFITFCDAIVTGGFGNAVIQKKDADELDVNTMLCCTMTVSTLLYGLIYFAAPWIADFYQMDIICPVLRVLSLQLLFSGINTIQHAWIQKQMLFRKFFIASSFGTALSAVVGISMAFLGAGVWALVAQNLTNIFVDTIVLFFTNDWRPKLMFSFARAKALLSYGGKVLLTTMVFTIGNDLRSLMVGRKFGPADLAYYDQGYKYPNLLVMNINSSITSVLFPILAQNQDNPERLKQLARRTIQIGMYVLTPFLVGLIAVADSFVYVLLSEKWAPCVPFLRIFTVLLIVRPFSNACHQTILSIGRSDVILKIMTTSLIISLGALFYAVFILESVLWIAFGRLISEVVNLILFCYYSRKLFAYQLKEQLRDMLPSPLLASIMGLLTYCIQFLPMGNLLTLIVQILFGAAFYVFTSWLLQAEPFVYLINMLCEKLPNNTIKRILLKMVRKKAM